MYPLSCIVTSSHQLLDANTDGCAATKGNPAFSGDIAAQFKLSLDNLEEVLRKADFSLSDVVCMTIFSTDVDKLISVWTHSDSTRRGKIPLSQDSYWCSQVGLS